MKTITIVTGNAHKLKEWQRLFPANFNFESVNLDLDEIQSLDSEAIIKDKVLRAYAKLKRPVLVEDVTAGLEKLNGLPGPFIKYFEEKLGKDALYQLAGEESPAIVTCTIAYYDGVNMFFSRGEVHGRVIAARGSNGFGFDTVFVATGQTKTFGEMEPREKDKISHRSQAVKSMIKLLS